MNQAIKFLHRPFRQGLVASRAVFASEYMVLLKTSIANWFQPRDKTQTGIEHVQTFEKRFTPDLQLLHNTPIFF